MKVDMKYVQEDFKRYQGEIYDLVEALEAAMMYAVEFPLELDSPQPQIDAWKVLSATKPFELIKKAKK